MAEDAQDRNIASTFAKGMEVLAAFDGSRATLTLADLARATGQDRAAARRGALTLVSLGYLRQDGREFRLTPRVLALAGGFLQANSFGRLVQPVLNHHAAALGVEIQLATRMGEEVLLLAESHAGPGRVSHGFTLGSRLALLHTSLGRMLLAGEPEGIAADLIAGAPLPRHTERSLTSRDAIAERIAAARAEGFAITSGEFEAGITGLAVPASRPGARAVVLGASRPDGTGKADHDAALRTLQLCAADLRRNAALEEI